ncbi:MAG: glutamyl-tRNA reductase [Deltaproteobacteria bacterium]|nr:glutamyl-tRNA reductase [Deltaproteobacteria bacterium]
MNIITVGLNHKSAPVEIREKLCFPADSIGEALKKLSTSYGINEAVILSTCNRVEITGVATEMEKGVRAVKRFLSEHHSIPLEALDEHLYVHTGEDAVKHLFRVASGLDSMVMGEPQILGQVKDAYGYAVEHSCAGIVINKLSHKAFSVAKRIRTETKIGAAAVSISYAAVELAKKIFGELEGKTAMLIGAGEMAELAAKHLLNSGVRNIIVSNRTFERAVELAKTFNGTAVTFREFPHNLKNTDIVIASTGSPKFIIRPEDIEAAMRERRHKPMFFIDISVPRNIDPLVNNVDGAYVYDIDDLQGVVNANLKERHKEAEEAEKIIDHEITAFYRWVKSLDVVPTIIALRQKFDRIKRGELDKAFAELDTLSGKEREVVEAMAAAIVNKILHSPVTLIKRNSEKVEGDMIINATRELFELEKEEAMKKAHGNSDKESS